MVTLLPPTNGPEEGVTAVTVGAVRNALIRLVPLGVPQPVQRSKPAAAKNLAALLVFVLLPVAMSWNVAA